MSWWSWAARTGEGVTPDHLPLPDLTHRHVGRERAVDAAACALALGAGALFLSPELQGNDPLSTTQTAVDVLAGLLACCTLWWRRRWPVAVAVACLLLGTVSSSATPAGLLALASLAVHRPARSAAAVTALWLPSVLAFAVYSPATDPVSVVLVVMPLALAATGWGMFLRARRQLLLSLQERALRAEADQELHEERARAAERARIAREMHDVLAHRISLMALHAGGLELRPDLPADQVRQTAALLRTTARQALEELRGVIGVLRDETGGERPPAAPQPTLSDLDRLVEERRRAGMTIDFTLDVDRIGEAAAPLGRDAYRIVQEALTNVGKHAPGATARVQVVGGPGRGLHITVRNRQPVLVSTTTPSLPGAGAGLLGLRERVALAGGALDLGPDAEGDFVVDAELAWQP